ncbi:DUF3833 domain-containing protein [Marinimicrobium alkaliphilum]|uniref:DUF3833 domain-containing protein n=1 Tax=Marinimicrobium alkaliphilum TaxID=2202654 RepID=UPI000DBA0856|nr:DUF3833 domain-containing protein [Marinimicrobium alkaliphilum]
MIKRAFIVSIVASLSACSSTDVGQYRDNAPVFTLEEFFDGHLTAHGVLKNRGGEVTRHFNASIDASWDDEGVGRLVERFEFDDGEIQHRTWTLTPEGDGRYSGTAEDVIGTGTLQVAGNALRLDYVLEIDYRGRKLSLNVEDWMWRIDENTVLNESTLRKWGFRVGSIQLAIVRQGQP